MKKKKVKKQAKKIHKGFTLVELLAVIVILAIIMIIAVPTVIDTMKTAQRKAMLTYAQKILNETEKKFMEQEAFGTVKRRAYETLYVYDIRKDLGLSNTGNYYGIVQVGMIRDYTWYAIQMFNDEYVLKYSSFHDDGEEEPVLTLDNIFYADEALNGSDTKFKDLPLKRMTIITNLLDECNGHDVAYVDGGTNDDMYCPNKAHYENFNEAGVCTASNIVEANQQGMSIAINDPDWTNCPIEN